MNFILFLIILTSLIVTIINGQEFIIKNLCEIDKFDVGDTDDDDDDDAGTDVSPTINNYCDCNYDHVEPWGLIVLHINCNDKNFENENFEAELLPTNAVTLDLSWNRLKFIPDLIGHELIELIITNNEILTIDERNFAKVPNLNRIDLSSNRISSISINAFHGLTKLKTLDLSHNQLKILLPKIFSNLPILENLILSENSKLNETFNQEDMDLFFVLGVSPKLKYLEINDCHLNKIDIINGVGLEVLHLKHNDFDRLPILPHNLHEFDFSDNPLIELNTKDLPHLFHLKRLYFHDMPRLIRINDYALFGLPNLHELVFEGSKKLEKFSPFAFGPSMEIAANKFIVAEETALNETAVKDDGDDDTNATDMEFKLKILNLRGCNLETLNYSLLFILENLTTFALDGNPFLCNCNIRWIKDNLNVETNAQCARPVALRGALISKIPGPKFGCKRWTDWIYKLFNGLLVLLLLIFCGVSIWLIVMGIRPSRKNQMQKIGSTSPYARVTIEPNRAEDTY